MENDKSNYTKAHCQLQTGTPTWYPQTQAPEKFTPAPGCCADGFPILIFSFFVLYFSHLQNRRFTLGLLSSFRRSPVAPETIRRHSNGLHTQNWK
ncbi:hypothetical protein QQF64_022339 [Cirrhinus molitorella]|uniref:Uncharacterized protein n=1 Tax=Cirrhinus molitorella TaxID=172907 RepID=A0ABR3L7X7_9TELE